MQESLLYKNKPLGATKIIASVLLAFASVNSEF